MAILYVKKMGGMLSELHSKIVKDLWDLGIKNNIWFEITHIPGIHNTESKWASRTLSEKTEYMLNHNVFLQTCEYFGLRPQIDLFASQLNAQVKDFYSFGPDPYCKWVDAFTIPWDKDCCYYMFAPFNLINRALAKIRRDREQKSCLQFCQNGQINLGIL